MTYNGLPVDGPVTTVIDCTLVYSTVPVELTVFCAFTVVRCTVSSTYQYKWQ